MKKNGFTLIELLVVVAIIGILAAVGVVAYNGYTKGAKIAAVKANHKMVVDYMRSEIMRCELGLVEYGWPDNNGRGSQSCKMIKASNVMHATVGSNDILRDKISNPYGCNAYCKTQGYSGKYHTITYGLGGEASSEFNIQNNLGVIFVAAVDDNGDVSYSSTDATAIRVTSCNKLPCDPTTGEGHMTTTFDVERNY